MQIAHMESGMCQRKGEENEKKKKAQEGEKGG